MKIAIIIEEEDVDQLTLFHTLPEVIRNIKISPAYVIRTEIQMAEKTREAIVSSFCKYLPQQPHEYTEFFGLPVKIKEK